MMITMRILIIFNNKNKINFRKNIIFKIARIFIPSKLNKIISFLKNKKRSKIIKEKAKIINCFKNFLNMKLA